ncbi:hypothetical protein NEFER02_2241 [Nematocida sp. LUAm2]|nr:hypothetical protein NEFER02_2241 [Nematocida sp. LUAm2]KAI5182005.1 hypothetical protein NEOKW01_2145 [Nematocida sp. AWRm80]
MKVIALDTAQRKLELIAFLEEGRYPDAIAGCKNLRASYKKTASKFRLRPDGHRLWIEVDGVFLKFFCGFERLDKLEALSMIHREIGHFKRDKILFDARKKIYSVTKEEAQTVVDACEHCQLRVRMKTRPENKVITAPKPGVHYQADLVDMRHYSEVNDGFGWILNIIDVNSKFLMSVPCKNKSAIEIKNAFVKVFRLYGEPKYLHTDNGTEFKNSLLRQYTEGLYIRRIFGRARHPQSQGQVERLNQTQKSVLSSLVLERGTNGRWIDFHEEAVSIINCTVHEAIRKRPIDVFFGRKIGNSNDNEFNDLKDIDSDIFEIDERYEQEAQYQEMHEAEMMQMEISNHRINYEKKIIKRRTWRERCGPLFKKDAKVLLYKDFDANSQNRKRYFDCETDGTIYLIVKISEDGLADIKATDSNVVIENVDIARLKIYKELK